MKKRTKGKTKTQVNRRLFPSIKSPSDSDTKKGNPIISIGPTAAFRKGDCPLCRFNPYYGVPLVFVLHYADKSIESVCYKCGKKVSEETGSKLPILEDEEYYPGRAKDSEILRKAQKRMEMRSNE